MSEKTRKTFVFVLLIGSVIWAYFTFTGQKPDSERRNTPRRSAVRPAPAAPVLVLSEQTAAEYEKRAWGKDPFYLIACSKFPKLNR